MSLLFAKSEPVVKRAMNMDDWIRGVDSGGKTKAGVVVTPDKALRVGAMWDAVNLLASVVSNLPVDVFRGTGPNKTPVEPAPVLVRMPSLIVTRREWTYQAMVSLLLRGNAYGLVMVRGPFQKPTVVEWLDPDSVRVVQKSSLSRPTYWLGSKEIPRGDVVHLRAFVRPGSAVGMSPVEYRAESLGIAIGARDYGAGWFEGGGHPTAVFKNTEEIVPPEQAKALKQRFVETVRGKREPLVTGKDWSYTPIQASAAESAFLESMGYSDAQIAKIFGPGLAEVLGYTTSGGSSLTYSNRVDRSLDLLTYTVMPWVNKFEDFWTDAIAAPQTARVNVNALLRADPKTRHEMYRIDREIGLYSIDELRALEDLPPLPDGAGQDYTPLKSGPKPAEGAPNGNQ